MIFALIIYPKYLPALNITIYSRQNGAGLEKDQKILADALQELGYQIRCKDYKFFDPSKEIYSDINIFFERIPKNFMSFASINWFIPNPEWFFPSDEESLKTVDLILCRTCEVERIFQSLQMNTFYLGFSSIDCFDSSIQKDFSKYILLGSNMQKGTSTVVKAWISNPNFPFLFARVPKSMEKINSPNMLIFPNPLEEAKLRELQNQCGVHVCISETEGFGHYIMEAMSTGGVVITTDAPPMNEFIKEKRCLVPYQRSSIKGLGINYYADRIQFEQTIKNIMNLSKEELLEIGKMNRESYTKKSQEFKENLKELMKNY